MKNRSRRKYEAALLLFGIPLLVAASWVVYQVTKPNYYSLAPAALEKGDPEGAERYYRLALERADRENSEFFRGISHLGLSKVAAQKKQWPVAKSEAETSILHFESGKNEKPNILDFSLDEAYLQLGLASVALREYGAAVESLEKSIDHYRRFLQGFPVDTKRYDMMANVCQLAGETGRLRGANHANKAP